MAINLKKVRNYHIFKCASFLYIVTSNNYDIIARAPNISLIQHGLNNLKNHCCIIIQVLAIFTLSTTYIQPYNKHN